MTPAKELQITTPTDTTIVLTRRFQAPSRLVWEAFFTPDKMTRWMIPPPGWTFISCECNPRLAGAVSIAWRSPEAELAMTLRGVFTEATAPTRATHTEIMALGSGQMVGALVETHEFTEKDGVTTMRITQTYESKEARDGAFAAGMDQGLEAGYQNLDAILGASA